MKREQVLPHVMADMAARIAKGADEYGEPLTTFNGRDALVDAYEEALDQCLYLKQAIMERKEVMQTGPVRECSTAENPVASPAVSESAAGEAIAIAERMISQTDDLIGAVASDGSMSGAIANGIKQTLCAIVSKLRTTPVNQGAVAGWPGPDWSQAPEGSTGWVMQNFGGTTRAALWLFGPGHHGYDGLWATDPGYATSVAAPTFNYPGDWRDSLRKRPK